MALFKKNEVPEIVESGEARAHREHLTRNFTIEVIPMKSLDNAREHLPPGAPLSVTASPVKGLKETQRLAEEFQMDVVVSRLHLDIDQCVEQRYVLVEDLRSGLG